MFFRKYSSAAYRAVMISLIYVPCWASLALLSEKMTLFSYSPDGFGRAEVLIVLLYFLVTTFLVFLIISIQHRKNAELESKLQFADETLEARVKIRTAELEKSLDNLDGLKGIIPICAHCKSIRNTSGGWEKIESYIQRHCEAQFSHGLCPDCDKALYGDRRLHFESIAGKYS